MYETKPTRRDVLKGVVAGGISVSAVGVAGGERSQQYLVTTRGPKARTRLEHEGFTVVRSLAGGDVLLVSGAESPADVAGVGEAVRNVRLHLERPVKRAPLPDPAADTENESLYPAQWDKQNTNVAAAHETTTGEGATIAVIDTGTDLDHPDLTPNVRAGALFRRVAGRGDNVVDSLADGQFTGKTDVRVPDSDLEEFAVTNAEGTVVGYEPAGFDLESRNASDDVEGHGSHVSGIAAASVGKEVFEGGTGIAGTAPDATVVPHRVFYWERQEVTYEPEEGVEETRELVVTSTTTADILTAIDFAANELGVDAMNLSIGTPPLPPQANREGFRQAYRLVVQDAVNAGSVVVVSAGNSDTELNKGGVFTVPNSVPGAMSIGATGPNRERAFYSNYGANELSLAAPGGGYETLAKTLADDTEWPFPTNLVLSTVPPDLNDGLAFDYYAGTSMAAPQVAGLVALVREVNPDLSAKQVQSVIENSARYANGKGDPDLGAGVVYAPGAVEAAKQRK